MFQVFRNAWMNVSLRKKMLYTVFIIILFRLGSNIFVPFLDNNAIANMLGEGTILNYLEETRQDTLHAETQIMIKPGYRFRVVEQLITNFHQPKSTLLLLVSAFVGEDWKKIYDYALSHDFRFLSYGDSSILTRKL